MGSLTIKVTRWNAGAVLRDQFMVPAADAQDWDQVALARAEINSVLGRIREGDTKAYSEVLGCWIEVTE